MKKLVVFLFAIGMLAIPLSSFADVGANVTPDFLQGTNGVSFQKYGANSQNMDVIVTQTGVSDAYYKSFNVGQNATVNFQFDKSNSTLINRVDVGAGASQILGKMTNSGAGAGTSQVILLNPNGFVFGKNAVVNLNSFTASALNGTYDLNSKKLNLYKGSTQGTINYDRTITTNNVQYKFEANSNTGDIIINSGAKIAGHKNVSLIAAKDVTAGDAYIATGKYTQSENTTRDTLGNVVDHNITVNTNKFTNNNGTVRIMSAEGGTLDFSAGSGKANSSDLNTKATGAMNINLNSTQIEAGKVVIHNKSTNKASNLNITSAKIQANSSKIDVLANNNASSNFAININKSELNAKNNVEVNAANGKVYVHNNSDISSADGNVTLHGGRSANIWNTDITANNGEVKVQADNGYLHVENNKAGAHTISAKSVNINNNTSNNNNFVVQNYNIETTDNISIAANKNATVNNNIISSTGGATSVTAKGTLNVTNNNRSVTVVTGKDANGKDIKTTYTGISGKGAVTISGAGDTKVNNNTIKSSNNAVTIQSTAGNLTLGDAENNGNTIKAKKAVTAQANAKDKTLTAYNNNITGGEKVTLKANSDTTLYSNTIKSSKNAVTIESTAGNLTLGAADKGNTIEAKKAVTAQANAKDKTLTAYNNTITGGEKVTLKANGAVDVQNNTNIQSTGNQVEIASTNGKVTAKTNAISAKTNISIHSDATKSGGADVQGNALTAGYTASGVFTYDVAGNVKVSSKSGNTTFKNNTLNTHGGAVNLTAEAGKAVIDNDFEKGQKLQVTVKGKKVLDQNAAKKGKLKQTFQ